MVFQAIGFRISGVNISINADTNVTTDEAGITISDGGLVYEFLHGGLTFVFRAPVIGPLVVTLEEVTLQVWPSFIIFMCLL